MSTILAIAWMTALEAARSRLAWLVAGFTIAGCALAMLSGEVAITETQGFRSGLLGAWLRMCAVFTVGLFVVASVLRELHDKGIELMLSAPVPRAAYYAGKLAGLTGVAVLTALACALPLLWCAPFPQVAIWTTSLGFELLIVTSMSLLCAFTFSQTVPATGAVIGFYVLARAMAALQLMTGQSVADPASAAQRFIRTLVDALAYVLPDLDRFTESHWLIHGTGTISDLGFVAIQTVVYVALLGAAGLFDLYRKAL